MIAVMRRDKPRYTIRAGTQVEVRKVGTRELRRHTMRKTLHFHDRVDTGYGGQVFYFQYREWIIAVNSRDVD